MEKNNLPPLHKAIKIALHYTHNLSFGGFKYLLLKNGEPKHLYKKQKEEYKNLKKILYNLSSKEWKHPFRKYTISSAYIAQSLKTLIEQGVIQKKDNRYLLSDLHKQAGQHANNQIILETYSIEQIYTPPDEFHKNQTKPITIYGINEEFIQHAKQTQMDTILEKKINKLIDIASQINELKYNIEERYKHHLLITKCQQLNDPMITKIVHDNIDKFIFLLTVTSLLESLPCNTCKYLKSTIQNPRTTPSLLECNSCKLDKDECKFDREKTTQEIEKILKRLEISIQKKKNQEEQLISPLLSDEQKINLLNILENIYNETKILYNQPDQTYLTSIVINHAPID